MPCIVEGCLYDIGMVSINVEINVVLREACPHPSPASDDRVQGNQAHVDIAKIMNFI